MPWNIGTLLTQVYKGTGGTRGRAVQSPATPIYAGLAQERLRAVTRNSGGQEPVNFFFSLERKGMTSRECHVPRTWP